MFLQITDILRHYEDQTIADQELYQLEAALTTVNRMRWGMLRGKHKTIPVRGMRTRTTLTTHYLQEVAACLYRIIDVRSGCDD